MHLTHPSRRLAALIIALIGVLAGAACDGGEGGDGAGRAGGSTPVPSPTPSPVQMSPIGPDANYNPADVAFAQNLLANLRQGTEMAKLAGDRAANPAIKTLAAKAEKDRKAGVILLPMWLESKKQPMPPTSAIAGPNGRAGLSSDAEMAALAAASGDAFDRLFVQMMIKNSEAADAMVIAEQWNGMNGPLIDLAHKVSDDQQVEIVALRALKDG